MAGSVRDYFLERAEAEIDLGNAARIERTANAHYDMAVYYLDRAQCGVANDDQP